MAKNPCKYTLKDGRVLSYDEMREYLLNNIEQLKQPTNASQIRSDAREVPQNGNEPESSQNQSSENIQRNPQEGTETGNGEKRVETIPPAEKEEVAPEEPTLGIKNEKTLQENRYMGLPDDYKGLTSDQKRDITTVQENAKKYKGDVETLVQSVIDNPRPMNAEELSAVLDYKIDVNKKLRQAQEDLITKAALGEDTTEQQIAIDNLTAKFKNANDSLMITGYEQGLAFRMRQIMKYMDYSLAESVRQYEAASGGKPVPEEIRQRFSELEKQINDLESKYDELQKKNEELLANQALENIQKSVNRQKQPASERLQALSEEKAKRKAELRKKFSGMFNDISNIPRLLTDKEFLEYNKLILEEAYGDFKIFVRQLTKELGVKIKPYARQLYEAVGGKFEEGTETPTSFLDDNGKLYIPPSLIRDVVESGVKNADDLAQKVHEFVVKELPDVTVRDVKEAVTEYGKTVNPTQDELKREIARLKREGRLELGLVEAQEGKGVKRSGLQREKPSDYERSMQRKIREELKKYPADDAAVKRKWASALDRTKTQLKNTITDLSKRIDDIKNGIAEPLPSKKRGFELDEEAKQLQEFKNQLREELDRLEPKPEMSDEQRVKLAVAGMERSIQNIADKISSGNLGYDKKQSKTNMDDPQIVAAKKRLQEGRALLERMRQESGDAERYRYELLKNRINKRIASLEEQLRTGDFETKPKPYIPVTDEMFRLKAQAEKLKFERDVAIEKAKLENRSMSEKVKDMVVDIANLPKSLLSTLDFSAVLRQGAILSAANPGGVPSALKNMFQQAFSEKATEEFIGKLHASPVYPFMKQAKLYLSEPTARLTAREEGFISNIAKKIPIIKYLVAGSERAYTGYLNYMRAYAFSKFYDAAVQNGLSGEQLQKELASYAKFINNATGRGSLGKAEASSMLLNTVMFSPRYFVSRINLLNPATYVKLAPQARIQALKSMGTYIGSVVLALSLLKYMVKDDDDKEETTVETDPRSSDFGKLKIGNTRYDLFAGFTQYIRVLAQLLSGEKKSTTTGEIKPLESGIGKTSRYDVMENFARSKLSPQASFLVDYLKGENMVGEKFDLSDELMQRAIPLYLQDMQTMYEEEGATKAAASAIPAIFGVGVQTYDSKPKKPSKEELKQIMKERVFPHRNKKTIKEKLYELHQKRLQEDVYQKAAEEYKMPYVPPNR